MNWGRFAHGPFVASCDRRACAADAALVDDLLQARGALHELGVGHL